MEQLSLFGEAIPIENSYMPQTDLKALYAFAKEQAQLHWQRDFDIEIELVHVKWRSRRGVYIQYLQTGRNIIRMSSHTNKGRTWEEVQGTLLHELVHWHLHTSGLPYHDSDIEFALECLRVGAPFSGTQVAQKTSKAAMRMSGMDEG